MAAIHPTLRATHCEHTAHTSQPAPHCLHLAAYTLLPIPHCLYLTACSSLPPPLCLTASLDSRMQDLIPTSPRALPEQSSDDKGWHLCKYRQEPPARGITCLILQGHCSTEIEPAGGQLSPSYQGTACNGPYTTTPPSHDPKYAKAELGHCASAMYKRR